MDLRALNIVVLVAAGGLFLASGTQREHSLLADGNTEAVRTLETGYASHGDAASLTALTQGYLDAQAPGLAISAVEGSPAKLRSNAKVQHTYARALLEAGRANDALAAEQRVLDTCAAVAEGDASSCDSWLLASATRRSDILKELVQLGIEDTQAHPEASAVAYQSATRQASLAAR